MAHIVKKNTPAGERRYSVRYKVGEKKRQKDFKTLREAQRFRAEKDLEAPKKRSVLGSNILFTGVAESWLQEREHPPEDEPLSPRTIRTYRSILTEHVFPYVGNTIVRHIDQDDFARMAKTMRTIGMAENTIAEARRLTLAVLGHAKETGIIETIPTPKKTVRVGRRQKIEDKLSARLKAYTPDEIYTLLRAADSLAEDDNKQTRRTWARYRPMVYMLALTGVRIGEARGFPRKDYRPNRREIAITQAATEDGIDIVKSEAGVRTLPLPPQLQDVMDPWLATHKNSLVFGTTTDNPLSGPPLYSRLLDPLKDRADLLAAKSDDPNLIEVRRDLRFHGFRHYYASLLVSRNATLKQLSTYLGHADPAFTLKVYAHLFEEDTADFADKIFV